eukprot:3136086-Prymnesium_polylepis.2
MDGREVHLGIHLHDQCVDEALGELEYIGERPVRSLAIVPVRFDGAMPAGGLYSRVKTRDDLLGARCSLHCITLARLVGVLALVLALGVLCWRMDGALG